MPLIRNPLEGDRLTLQSVYTAQRAVINHKLKQLFSRTMTLEESLGEDSCESRLGKCCTVCYTINHAFPKYSDTLIVPAPVLQASNSFPSLYQKKLSTDGKKS